MKSILRTAAAAAIISVASARVCHNLTIPVTISARNGVFNITTPTDNIAATDFILNFTQQGNNFTAAVTSGYTTVSGTYGIDATYCEPDHGRPDIVQILTHGIGFDKSYWDLSANNYNYSYVKDAVDCYGYATLAYDRLGVGQSSLGDPLAFVQAPIEVAALASITTQLRNGAVPGLEGKQFNRAIHVGHSFGSIQTYALTVANPELSDGIVLTGFSQNSSFVPFFALGGNFNQAPLNPALARYPPGYLAPASSTGVQINFFGPGDFDPAILQVATSTGQPVSVGELLTLGGLTGAINNFTGPALIITGERDIPFCGGDCFATGGTGESIPAAANKTLPQAQNFEAYVVPGAGHGLNLGYSHVDTYEYIFNYLADNDLSP